MTRERPEVWWCYILCSHDVTPDFARTAKHLKFYTGISTEPKRRLQEHNAGYCKSTRGKKWYPLIAIKCGSQLLAARIERWLKTGNTVHKRDNALLYAGKCSSRFFAARGFLTMFSQEWITWQNNYLRGYSLFGRRSVAYYNHMTGGWQQAPLDEESLAPIMEKGTSK